MTRFFDVLTINDIDEFFYITGDPHCRERNDRLAPKRDNLRVQLRCSDKGDLSKKYTERNTIFIEHLWNGLRVTGISKGNGRE